MTQKSQNETQATTQEKRRGFLHSARYNPPVTKTEVGHCLLGCCRPWVGRRASCWSKSPASLGRSLRKLLNWGSSKAWGPLGLCGCDERDMKVRRYEDPLARHVSQDLLLVSGKGSLCLFQDARGSGKGPLQLMCPGHGDKDAFGRRTHSLIH